MNYVERNAQIAAEIRSGVLLKRGRKVGSSNSGMGFYPFGSYNSEALGGVLHLGLKEFSRGGITRRQERWLDNHYRKRAALELAIIALVTDKFPQRLAQFPQFYGLVVNWRNKARGIIMEDLSAGGTVKVEDMRTGVLEPFPDRELLRDIEVVLEKRIGDVGLKEAAFNLVGQNRIVVADMNQLLPREEAVGSTVEAMRQVLTDQAIQVRGRF